MDWIEAKQPVIGLFHNMTNIKPMIEMGLIESRRAPRCKGQLLITDTDKAPLTNPTKH